MQRFSDNRAGNDIYAQRRDRFVICATAPLRYLPEPLRGQFGLSGHWSAEPPKAAMCRPAVVGATDRLLLQAITVSDTYVEIARSWKLSLNFAGPRFIEVVSEASANWPSANARYSLRPWLP
jgi:hypothetical protein